MDAQIFEAVGINSNVINRYFPGTPSRIEGIGLDTIAREVIMRHSNAFNTHRNPYQNLLEGVTLHWRKESRSTSIQSRNY